MAARSKAPAIGSAGWILEERHQSNALVAQELEDFGFSVRNELEWLNEHMSDIFANDGQNNLDVFKTPGKLRGKTPRTARKKNAEPRQQPLSNVLSANSHRRLSPAEMSLRNTLLKSATKPRFHIAEDADSMTRVQSPTARTPVARQLFSNAPGSGKENIESSIHTDALDKRLAQPLAAPWSPVHSTQDSAMTSDDVFSPPQTQSTQPTQATDSFKSTFHEEDGRRDTGDSFVSANEAFGSRKTSKEGSRHKNDDAMDVDDSRVNLSHSDAQGTVVHHELSSNGDEDEDMEDIPDFPAPPRVVSEQYSISADTHDALDAANYRALVPEPKNLFAPNQSTTPSGPPPPEELVFDDTVVHHDVDDQMDMDDDVRSPSDNSSPVKPLVRKSSLTFASLPAREPLIAKKSMGNRVSRTSHLDQTRGRNSQMGRFTGGKSLGGSQLAHPAEAHQDDHEMDIDTERPELSREESETTKIHNKTSTQRLFERINMLKQQNDAPKRISQNIQSTQSSQPQNISMQLKEDVPQAQASQLLYPALHTVETANDDNDDDDDDDWISPVLMAAPAPKTTRPALSKSHTAEPRQPPVKPKPAGLVSVSNPDLSSAAESTTPVGSPTGKKYMDGALSASKSKLYSAFRSAKEKLIGSSATSAQAKLDVLNESPRRPQIMSQDSADDIFTSPKRTEKPAGIFSHIRSPSKESNKSTKSNKSAMVPGSPTKSDGRHTRSSTEREKQKERDTKDKDVKEAKQQQRAEDRLRDMREKEQSKAAAQHQKARAIGAKTPSAMSSTSSLRQPTASTAVKTPVAAPAAPQQPLFRPGHTRTNTASSKEQEFDSADEMPPPPPPKSLLPTTKTTKASLREPRKLTKPTSKDTLPKTKAPQKIMVNLNSSTYGRAPPPAPRPAPVASKQLPVAPQAIIKPTAPAPRPIAAAARPASAMAGKAGSSKAAQPIAKPTGPRLNRAQTLATEKPKAPAPAPRADLGAARPVSRMQTVQDATRINIPQVNPAKPPKRPFQGENDETLHRPAKRPSQQAKMNPITPAHAQFAKGKIPFAESVHPPQPQVPAIQYPNGDDIKLPEIMTDSEDEDSDNDFEQPSWVNTPNLREMLSNQQLMDPETIFGPIPALEMEKVFPNKERHKRFRERTSSAFWANDEVTAEEKRKEKEARERLVREGAWTYNPSPRPTPAGPSR
ncbi:inner centromere protein-like protein [Plenodomus tracheiphilus IPT5]|uniref:Inner centromere protein-like protein n=1 Tax=Plenodomus tracheiphilus IPT5 TaxID=1408161 RepID=A0A6A7ARY4_9PLEO|nr:inner centromere protein-like protein [Plenodomus tracheiphilus IPT5]